MTLRQENPARRRWHRACASAMVVLLAWGVGSGCGHKHPDHVPSSCAAREALDAALTAWVNGKRVGIIDTTSPAVQVVDNNWWKGWRLASYEVLDEELGKDGLYRYTVRLHLSKPSKEATVHYLVTGRSPRWVYREEDYKSSQSWEGYK